MFWRDAIQNLAKTSKSHSEKQGWIWEDEAIRCHRCERRDLDLINYEIDDFGNVGFAIIPIHQFNLTNDKIANWISQQKLDEWRYCVEFNNQAQIYEIIFYFKKRSDAFLFKLNCL